MNDIVCFFKMYICAMGTNTFAPKVMITNITKLLLEIYPQIQKYNYWLLLKELKV